MKRVLILCTGNSCRSQMAEALWESLGSGKWESESAGSKPSGYVHPLTVLIGLGTLFIWRLWWWLLPQLILCYEQSQPP